MSKRKPLLHWARHQQRWFGKWHLYLGIIAGLIVSIVGVTGSILVFKDEIDEALNPRLFNVLEQQRRLPFDEILPIVKARYPDLDINYIMNEANNPATAYRIYTFKKEEETFINPYTGEKCGKRIYESSFIHIVTEIHRTLLIPAAGRYIVGIASLILLMLTITGLRLWIPQKWKQLKSVLTVNFKMGFKRQNYDWHNVLGFYSAPVISLIALTGVTMTFQILVIPLLFLLSGKTPQGVQQLLGARSTYVKGTAPAPLKTIVTIAGQTMPGSYIGGMNLPKDSTGAYRFDMVTGNIPRQGKREMIIIDQYSGKVLLNSRKDFPNVGNAYLGWLTPIHFGSFGGRPTQILALLAGLMPLALFITGFIIWWPRYKKQKKNERKKTARNLTMADAGTAAEVTLSLQPALPRLSYDKHFVHHLKKGAGYAGYFVLIAAIMGALYGLFAGIIWQPAIFAILFSTTFVILNFIVALLVMLLYLLSMAPFRINGRVVVKYFAISLSFLIIFLIAYFVLRDTISF